MAMDRVLIAKRISAYERLIRLDKPVGALLLLWPTLWALWLAADGRPGLDLFLIFFTGTVLMRSAGCAINDYADRHFDAHVERTRARPLAAGEITPEEALLVGAALALAAFGLVLFLDRMAIALSFVGLAIAASYPFTKRFFALPQAYLGIAFGFGIPMAYAAVRGELPEECWLLLAANIFYAFCYDTEYAMVDRDDDVRIGMKTLALVGARRHIGWPFYAGLGIAAAMMVYHWFLIRGRSREGCFKAFMHNNWVGAAIFAGIASSFLVGEPW
jgi:4-hydroxybenzoate polyprenyltransferase